jgi:serine/threonine-protein kinase
LLFGILALQMEFISRDALIGAMGTWVLDKKKPLGDILRDQGHLQEHRLRLLKEMVEEHLRAHNDDPQRSLAALAAPASVHRQLRSIADADVQASLDSVAATTDTDPGATGPYQLRPEAAAASRYRVLRPHARGGLGEVFVAEDTELDRQVALKEIREHRAHDPHSRSRFLLEAKITGGLEHPGIVPVHGLGQYEDGRPYYAMRLIQGDTFKEAIGRFHQADVPDRQPGERSLALRKLLSQFVTVCNAVAYAHSRGVINRDIKDANIMLGKFGETLVIDWGLAKVVGRPEGADEADLTLQPSGEDVATQMGTALGTPAYMSPEAAAGRLDLLSRASDIYSLGATLYKVLTGRPPIQGSDAGEVLRKASRGEWLPPRQVKKDVPAGDVDLARLYGVTTAALNQAVKRNAKRFPADFAFRLTRQEFRALMSQTVTSKPGRGGRRKLPWAFTEQGVAMLSSVLRSAKAVQVNVEIMRAFVRLRRLLATPGELVEQLAKLAETVQLHDEHIKAIAQVLRQMIEKPPEKPKAKIGFQTPPAKGTPEDERGT